MSFVVVGTFNLDTIETPQETRERIVGGSGTYCCLAASYFTHPMIVGVVGDDFPVETLDLFRDRGVDARGLEVRQGKTFFWKGRYAEDPNKRTTLATEVNVLKGYRPQIPEEYRDAGILFLANIDPDLQDGILSQVRNPSLVAMDTMNFWIHTKLDSLLSVIRKVNVFFANDEEIKMITRESNLVKAARKILQTGPSLVVLKKGEHGVLLFGDTYVCGIPAHPSDKVVDPTGAGDSFGGGFLGYLDKVQSFDEKDVRVAAVYGSVMASFVIEDFGIEPFKTLSKASIEARYAEFQKLVSF
jgi:sugar/nucleoside kinase (ribokinase family)